MKKARVRIAVAVDPHGNWNACGWHCGDEKDMMEAAIDGVEDGEACYWLVAELDIPETREIEASIEDETDA